MAWVENRVSVHGLSRLKGMETRKKQHKRQEEGKSVHGLSRLKGMETKMISKLGLYRHCKVYMGFPV